MNPFVPDRKYPPDTAALNADQSMLAKGPSEETERWLRAAVQNYSDFVMILETDTTVRYVSPAVEQVIGYRPEDFAGTMVLDYVHPEDLEYMSKSFAEAVENPGVQPPIEYRFRTADGSWRHMEAILSNLLDNPSVAGLVSNVRDVTERKKAEEALKESEERFRTIFEDAPVGMALVGLDGRRFRANRFLCEMLGCSEEDLLGENYLEHIHPDDRQFSTEHFERALEEVTESYKLERRYLHADGNVVWNLTTVSLIRDPKGDPSYFVCLHEDITERKHAQEALRESEEFFRALYENVHHPIFLADKELNFVDVNPYACEFYGYSREEFKQMKVSDLTIPEELASQQENSRELFQKGEIVIPERRHRKKNGEVITVTADATTVTRADQVLFVSRITDITERKYAEERLKRSELSLAAAQERARLGSWEWDISTDQLRWSDEHYRIFGHTPQSFTPTFEAHYLNAIHPEDRERVEKANNEAFEGRPYSIDYRIVKPDGERRHVHSQGEVVFDEGSSNELVGMAGTVQDITERKQAEEALRKSQWRMAEAERLAHIGSWEWDLRSNTLSWSDELYRIFGLSKDVDISYEGFIEGIHPSDREFVRGVIQAICEDYVPQAFSHRIVWPDETVRWLHCEAVVTVDEAGNLESLHGMTQDITELRQAEERLKHQAFHDSLTNLPNRQLFIDRLKQALRHTRRRSGRKVGLLFMDLDKFKVVNDSLGHEMGDRVIVAVGERIRGCLRPEDTLARFGGDEFAILVDDIEDPADAVRVAERVIEAHREPFVLEGRELFIKPSVGIALGTARTSSYDELLRDADTAMYRAKQEGLAYQVFEPVMYEQALRRFKMENELQRAIESEEFVVHYQPIINLLADDVWGVEALVRWQHPERGLLDPSEFVPAAEESGLVVPMGERVLKEACEQAKEWQASYPRILPLVMAVNLSARQLGRPDVVRTVEGVLKETGLEARCLCLDITETVYVKDLESNTAALEELKRLGMRISIDDFGTGYSSLSYLKRLPADALKIDKSFIGGLGEDIEDTALVQMIIDLAHTLGMEVIAEGVESEAQAEQLKQMGCDLGQGYHLARPLSPEAASKVLAR